MMRRVALSTLTVVAICFSSPLVEAVTSREVLPEGGGAPTALPSLQGPFRRPASNNLTLEMLKLNRGPSLDDLEAEKKARKERNRQRSARARDKLKTYRPDPSDLHRMTKEQVAKMKESKPSMRGLSWGRGSSSADYADFYLDHTQEYDMWSQAYRMIGGYIDCDHSKDQGSGDHNSGDNYGGGNSGDGCSRWMIWAAVSIQYH